MNKQKKFSLNFLMLWLPLKLWFCNCAGLSLHYCSIFCGVKYKGMWFCRAKYEDSVIPPGKVFIAPKCCGPSLHCFIILQSKDKVSSDNLQQKWIRKKTQFYLNLLIPKNWTKLWTPWDPQTYSGSHMKPCSFSLLSFKSIQDF